MGLFDKQKRFIRKISKRSFINAATQKAINDNNEIFEEFVTEDQLFEKGIAGDGIKLSSFAPYSPTTINIKKLKGQKTSVVTLRDTGRFHEKFKIKGLKNHYTTDSKTPYTKELIEKYDKEIMQLTPENENDMVRFYVVPQLIKNIRKELG